MKKQLPIYLLFAILVISASCRSSQDSSKAEVKLPQDQTGFSPIPTRTVPVQVDTLTARDAPNVITRTALQDKSGNIWFTTFGGLIKYDGTTFTQAIPKARDIRFFSALEDSKGNLWFGSIGSGVFRYNGKSWKNFTTKDGLVSDRVTKVYEDSKGNMWFGTTGGVSCYDGNSFKNFTTADGLPANETNAIIEYKGMIWFGTKTFASAYDGKAFTNMTNDDGEFFENVRDMTRDSKGRIWIGGNSGLWRYDGRTLTQVTSDFVGYIHEDRKGNIWTSSQSRNGLGWMLSRYDAASLDDKAIQVKHIKTNESMLFGILEDADENIWLGKLNGVYRYDGQAFTYFKR